jgi:hypothetical protein
LRLNARMAVKLLPELFWSKDLNVVGSCRRICPSFLDIIYILYNGFFIKFHAKNKTVDAHILAAIESELKRTCHVTIIRDKNLKVIGSMNFKLIAIKDHKFLITLSQGYKTLAVSPLIIKKITVCSRISQSYKYLRGTCLGLGQSSTDYHTDRYAFFIRTKVIDA